MKGSKGKTTGYVPSDDDSSSSPHHLAKLVCRKEFTRELVLKETTDHFNGSRTNLIVGSKVFCTRKGK